MAMRHPDHDRLVQVVPTLYTTPAVEMGYHVERRPFGFFGRNVYARAQGSVVVRGLRPHQVPEFLADVRGYFGKDPVRILIDDREAHARLGPALLAAGCSRAGAQTFLAHVGPVPEAPSVPGLTIEPVTPTTNLDEYVVTKIKGFADSEAEPAPNLVSDQLALRRAELAGEGRFLLARWDGTPVAVLAWYEGEDRLLFHLATRVPFRNRGIAKALLAHILTDTYRRKCRSIILFADPDDTPIHLYSRLGFVDEVYWRQMYRVQTEKAEP